MALIDFYPVVKPAHVALVLASGGLFATRGVAVIAGAGWAMARPLRSLSVAIDTALLGTGVALMLMLDVGPLVAPWLGVKLALLPVYVVLGTLALKRARSERARIGWLVAALLCYGFMITVARAHDPLGVLRGVLS